MSETPKCRDVKQSRDAKMVFMNDQPRSYGGVDGALRVAQRREALIEAGLELMGSAEPELTVRGVCKKAGVAARYFYESFTDRDALMRSEEHTSELQSLMRISYAVFCLKKKTKRKHKKTKLH